MAKGNPNPERHLENLLPFKPGESGNPAGRPPNVKYISEYLRAMLQMTPDEIKKTPKGERTAGWLVALRILDKAMHGEWLPANGLLDRTEGKVTDKTEHSGSLAVSWAEVLRGADGE